MGHPLKPTIPISSHRMQTCNPAAPSAAPPQVSTSLAAIPAVGMGTFVRNSKQSRDIGRTAATFYELGGRLIDTAPTYGYPYGSGTAQLQLGKAIARLPREQLWLISKIPIQAMGFESTLQQVNDSLRDLGTSHLELVLVHRATNSLTVKGAKQQRVTRTLRIATWRALLAVQHAGLVRHIGVSNHGIVYLRELAEAGLPAPEVNEIELHPWIDARQRALLRYCRSHGIYIIAYNSLGGLGASHSTPFVASLANKHGKSEAQILLRWGIEQGATVIPSAHSKVHIHENLVSADFRLTPEEVANISAEPKPRKWASFPFNDPHHVDSGSLGCDTAETLIARHEEELSKLQRLAAANGRLHPTALASYVLDASNWPAAGLCTESSSSGHALAHTIGKYIARSRHPFIVLPRYLSRELKKMTRLSEWLHAERAKLYDPRCNASKSCLTGAHSCSRRPDGRVAYPGHTLASQWVPAAGDMRCYGCQSFSPLCTALLANWQLLAIATAFYDSTGSPEPPTAKTVLANALEGAGANSGGEFHQDEMGLGDHLIRGDVTPHQMKCLTYLEDVGPLNGPFTMLVNYNMSAMSRQYKRARNVRGFDPVVEPGTRNRDPRSHRFKTDTIIEALRCGEAYLVELHGPKGTVICFDSGSIHRGKLIVQGRRSSATLYFSSPRSVATERKAPRQQRQGDTVTIRLNTSSRLIL